MNWYNVHRYLVVRSQALEIPRVPDRKVLMGHGPGLHVVEEDADVQRTQRTQNHILYSGVPTPH